MKVTKTKNLIYQLPIGTIVTVKKEIVSCTQLRPNLNGKLYRILHTIEPKYPTAYYVGYTYMRTGYIVGGGYDDQAYLQKRKKSHDILVARIRYHCRGNENRALFQHIEKANTTVLPDNNIDWGHWRDFKKRTEGTYYYSQLIAEMQKDAYSSKCHNCGRFAKRLRDGLCDSCYMSKPENWDDPE